MMNSNLHDRVKISTVLALTQNKLLPEIIDRYFVSSENYSERMTFLKLLFAETLGLGVNSCLGQILLDKITLEYYKSECSKIASEFRFVDDTEDIGAMKITNMEKLNLTLGAFSVESKIDAPKVIHEYLDKVAVGISRVLNSTVIDKVIENAFEKHVEKLKNKDLNDIIFESAFKIQNITAPKLKEQYNCMLVPSGTPLDLDSLFNTVIETEKLHRVVHRGYFEITPPNKDSIIHSFRWDFSKKDKLGYIPPIIFSNDDMFSKTCSFHSCDMDDKTEPVQYWDDIRSSFIPSNYMIEFITSLPDDFFSRLPIQEKTRPENFGMCCCSLINEWETLGLNAVQYKKFHQLLSSIVCLENMVAMFNMGARLPFNFVTIYPSVKRKVKDMIYLNLKEGKHCVNVEAFDVKFFAGDNSVINSKVETAFSISTLIPSNSHVVSTIETMIFEGSRYSWMMSPSLEIKNTEFKKFSVMLPPVANVQTVSAIDFVGKIKGEDLYIKNYQQMFRMHNKNIKKYTHPLFEHHTGGVNSIATKLMNANQQI